MMIDWYSESKNYFDFFYDDEIYLNESGCIVYVKYIVLVI